MLMRAVLRESFLNKGKALKIGRKTRWKTRDDRQSSFVSHPRLGYNSGTQKRHFLTNVFGSAIIL
jgi:hypothetical protein